MNKMIAAILAVVAFFVLDQYSVPAFSKLAEEIVPPYALTVTPQEGTWREQLDERQQQLYDAIKGGLLEHQTEIVVKRLGFADDADEVIWCVMQDSPELFWVNWQSWTAKENTGGLTVTVESLFEASQISDLSDLLDASIEDIVDKANKANSDYDRILLIHDYLVNTVTYNEQDAPLLHSAYGALVEGIAASDGYASAFCLLMNRLGIESLRIDGRLRGDDLNSSHSWNIVRIGDNYSQIDVALDDVGHHYPDGWKHQQAISYSYFLLSDDEASVSRMAISPVVLPACESYGFFEKQNLQAPGAFASIQEAVAEKLYQNIKQGKYYVEFRLLDAAELGKATAVATRYEYCQKAILDAVNTKLHHDNAAFRLVRFESPYVSGDCVLLLAVPEQNQQA